MGERGPSGCGDMGLLDHRTSSTSRAACSVECEGFEKLGERALFVLADAFGARLAGKAPFQKQGEAVELQAPIQPSAEEQAIERDEQKPPRLGIDARVTKGLRQQRPSFALFVVAQHGQLDQYFR